MNFEKVFAFAAILFLGVSAFVFAGSISSSPYTPNSFYQEPTWGSEGAKVKVVAYIGFEERFSGVWYWNSFGRIISEYEPNEVSVTFVNAPLDFLPNEINAMKASECAARQNSYWRYIPLLYLNRTALSEGFLFAYAEKASLNMKLFNKCFNSPQTLKEVLSDKTYAFGVLGLSGVPTFFVNDRQIVGAQPYDVFKQAIDQELAG